MQKFPEVVDPSPAGNSSRVAGRLTALALAFAVAGSTASVRAAPPGNCKEQVPVCEATPTLDEAKRTFGRDLSERALEHYDAKNFLDALKTWEQMLVLLPEKEAGIRVQLAYTHRAVYLVEGDEKHLQSARRLFTAQLDGYEPDSPERAVLAKEVAAIDAQLDALEADRQQKQQERDEQIRQQEIRRSQAALAKVETQRRELERRQANSRKILFGVGGSLMGLGVGSAAAMTAFLVHGERLEQEGVKLAGSSGGEYLDLLVRGETENRAAVATGVVGGLLMAAGGVLLAIAADRHKQARSRMALYPTLGGLRLQF